MTSPLVECVPNISEGRDLATIEAIVDAVRSTDGCTVLGVEPDADYHRTVITFAGPPESVVEGAIALIEASVASWTCVNTAVNTLDWVWSMSARSYRYGTYPWKRARTWPERLSPAWPSEGTYPCSCTVLQRRAMNEPCSLDSGRANTRA